MATIEEINKEYAVQEQSANYFLSRGMTGPAHQAHLRMQDLAGQRDEIVQAQASSNTSTGEPYDAEAAYRAELERRRTQNAVASLSAVMADLGLSSLMTKIQGWVTDGYEQDAIMALIRQTPEYDQRFPAMKQLAKKGRAISEAEYISFERTAAQMERAYGLPQGMLDDKDTVTGLLTNEVSARELQERVDMAAVNQYKMPKEIRDQFTQYYGVQTGGLTAYFLDPDKALPLLERQYTSAQIGAEAAMQDIGIHAAQAEYLYTQGVDRELARAGFANVARQETLSQGRGDVVSQESLIQGNLLGDSKAIKEIDRAVGARKGAFQEGGGYTATSTGVAGLASAAQ